MAGANCVPSLSIVHNIAVETHREIEELLRSQPPATSDKKCFQDIQAHKEKKSVIRRLARMQAKTAPRIPSPFCTIMEPNGKTFVCVLEMDK